MSNIKLEGISLELHKTCQINSLSMNSISLLDALYIIIHYINTQKKNHNFHVIFDMYQKQTKTMNKKIGNLFHFVVAIVHHIKSKILYEIMCLR